MNNQHEQNHEQEYNPMVNCQICQQTAKVADTLAGSFDRVCKKCSDEGLDDLSKPMCLIKEGIFIGSQLASRNQALLKQHKIGAICVCGSDLKVHIYEDLNVQRMIIPIKDTMTQNIISKLPDAVKWIQNMRKKNLNVLIHCAGGISRSASISIAYLMEVEKLPFRQSYLCIKKSRKCIKPNQAFTKQLKQYQKYLNGKYD